VKDEILGVNFKTELFHLSNTKFDGRTLADDFSLLSTFFTRTPRTSSAQIGCGHAKTQLTQMV